MKKLNFYFSNIFGSFSDAAILFPLIITICLNTKYQISTLFLTTGLVYIISGYFFKVPISVQPLKSIVISGIALKANFLEIKMAGILIGIILLILLFLKIDKLLEKVPMILIHGVQLGLGLLLLNQGIQYLLKLNQIFMIFSLLIFFFLILFNERLKFPLLGVVATIGVGISFFNTPEHILTFDIGKDSINWSLVLSLILPQICLTSANSIVATKNVCQSYFKENAQKVTIKNLLMSIGFGNLIIGFFGGLPFCHGSGGVTAHYKGGSNHPISNYFIGLFLLILSVLYKFFDLNLYTYPTLLLSSLLLTVGVFHLRLAKNSWNFNLEKKLKLSIMGLTVFATQNLFYLLIIGLGLEIISYIIYSSFKEKTI